MPHMANTVVVKPCRSKEWILRVRTALAAVAVVIMVPVALLLSPTPSAEPPAQLFAGDYASGDFSQWLTVQTKAYNGPAADYPPGYPASIVQDSKGDVARFEVRKGDVPPFGGGERAEVQGDSWSTGGAEGEVRWYKFSTKFDTSFPKNHADLGWGVTNQWHPDSDVGSPPVSWTVGMRNGYWSLTISDQSAPDAYLGTFSIFDTPLAPGEWHDVKMQIRWSESATGGSIKLWLNGVPQKFANGTDTYVGRTLIPGTTSVYYKEGMYRAPMAPTDIVYHTGFGAADSEDAL
ncbi:MAG: hypothetical protein QOJ24_4256 [Mycobacterium sp.]|nr:hypothetical protein [Mycobacterium sp.]